MDITVFDVGSGTTITRPATAAEEAAILTQIPPDPRLELDKQEAAEALLSTQITTFLNWTPAELESWLINNIDNAVDLATLKANTHTALYVLGRLAIHAARNRHLR